MTTRRGERGEKAPKAPMKEKALVKPMMEEIPPNNRKWVIFILGKRKIVFGERYSPKYGIIPFLFSFIV